MLRFGPGPPLRSFVAPRITVRSLPVVIAEWVCGIKAAAACGSIPAHGSRADGWCLLGPEDNDVVLRRFHQRHFLQVTGIMIEEPPQHELRGGEPVPDSAAAPAARWILCDVNPAVRRKVGRRQRKQQDHQIYFRPN